MRDRGSIKWVSMMLPEHVKALREWKDEQDNPTAQIPAADEQTYEEWNYCMYQAIHDHVPVSVTYIDSGRPQTARGYIKTIHEVKRQLDLFNHSGSKVSVPLDCITGMHMD